MELRADSTSNRSVLVGRVIEREPLRYTPAGIPIVRARLAHESKRVEAGAAREVRIEIDCVAVETLARLLASAPIGATVEASGFLAAKSKMSRTLVLHIEQLQFLAASDDAGEQIDSV
ncbi:MAG: primosomal replication protein N [Burkholderiales bacterium]